MNHRATEPDDALDVLLRDVSAAPTGIPSQHLEGKRVLVTGAGGSIGTAIANSVWACSPQNLVLLDTSENGLYQIDRRLCEAGSHHHVPVLGSVCDANSLSHLLKQYRPQVVFHAAALKHVPLMEQNPFAAMMNNAAGTLTLAKLATDFHVEHLVLVSTDKAADPSSMMGASKRIAELALLAVGATARTRMTAVRLGNVVGSQGSVLPLFMEQIARGGPVTVTHSEAHRYFITMDRAVRSLFAALGSGTGAAILAPDLGPQVRIADLARRLLKKHASSAGIDFIGLRPGDKMMESPISSRECWAEMPQRSGLRAVTSTAPSLHLIDDAVQELREATCQRDLPRMLRVIRALVPEYQPSSVILDSLHADASQGALA